MNNVVQLPIAATPSSDLEAAPTASGVSLTREVASAMAHLQAAGLRAGIVVTPEFLTGEDGTPFVSVRMQTVTGEAEWFGQAVEDVGAGQWVYFHLNSGAVVATGSTLLDLLMALYQVRM